MRRYINLLSADIKSISRDGMVFIALLSPLIIAVAGKLGIPLISRILMSSFNFELEGYYPAIICFIIVLIPFILGMASGLLLMDEKDQNILQCISVTPMSQEGYIFYKLILPVAVSILTTNLAVKFIGLVEFNLAMIPVSVLSALQAPIIALLMVKYASNKIEGLAMSKALGFVLFIALCPFFIKSKWTILLSVIPTYWIGEVYQNIGLDYRAYFISLFCGLVVTWLYILYLYKKV